MKQLNLNLRTGSKHNEEKSSLTNLSWEIPFRQHESKEEKNKYLRAWRKLHPGYDKKQRDPEKTREKWWFRRYKITRQDYDSMLKSQNGVCAICTTNIVGRKHSYFHVDHDHSTGKVRGLLCDLCNRGLGYFKERPEVFRKAAEYLDAHNKH